MVQFHKCLQVFLITGGVGVEGGLFHKIFLVGECVCGWGRIR